MSEIITSASIARAQTEAANEIEAQRKSNVVQLELAKTRKVLTADELAVLVNPRPRLELHMSALGAFLFSIDGVLVGKKVRGCLFAGECMLVYGETEEKARKLAQDGLFDTIALLHEEYQTRDQRLNQDVYDGLQVDGGGRKGGRQEREPQVAPKLKAMMAHILAGKPWKW